MRFLIGVIAVIIVGYIGHLIFPAWWMIVIIVALISGGMGLNPLPSFGFGFVGVALLWGANALFIDLNNNHLLSAQVGQLFQGLGSVALILIVVLLGGLLGGMGALTGALARQLLKNE